MTFVCLVRQEVLIFPAKCVHYVMFTIWSYFITSSSRKSPICMSRSIAEYYPSFTVNKHATAALVFGGNMIGPIIKDCTQQCWSSILNVKKWILQVWHTGKRRTSGRMWQTIRYVFSPS